MILECTDWQRLIERLPRDAFGIKTACTLDAYGGPTDFLKLYEGKKGVALLFQREMLLCGQDPELLEFMLFHPGWSTLLCGTAGLPFMVDTGWTFRAEGRDDGTWDAVEAKPLRDFLCGAYGLQDGDDALYVDLSHRLRHGTTHVVKTVGGVSVVHDSPAGLLLSALAVESSARGRGIGTRLAERTAGTAAGPIFLFSRDEYTDRLYERAGYQKDRRYYLYRRGDKA